ncbi:VCBS repeat-containing protein, partial [Endozoicomonas sp. SM1973]
MLSKGDGTFGPAAQTMPSADGYIRDAGWAMQMADIDGDGLADSVGLFIGTDTDVGIRLAPIIANYNHSHLEKPPIPLSCSTFDTT